MNVPNASFWFLYIDFSQSYHQMDDLEYLRKAYVLDVDYSFRVEHRRKYTEQI